MVDNLTSLSRANAREMLLAFKLDRLGHLQVLAEWLASVPARRLARKILHFDDLVGRSGLATGGRYFVEEFTGSLCVEGQQHVPRSGPLLAVSNHPGMVDAMAIWVALEERPDLKIIASDRDIFHAVPNIRSRLLLVDPRTRCRSGLVRAAIGHLRQGKALLTFPAGAIEPDPSMRLVTTAAGWSDSSSVLVRAVPETVVLPIAVSGVISATAHRHPLATRFADPKEREWAAATLQVLFRHLRDTRTRVVIGERIFCDRASVRAEVQAAMAALLARVADHGAQSTARASAVPEPWSEKWGKMGTGTITGLLTVVPTNCTMRGRHAVILLTDRSTIAGPMSVVSSSVSLTEDALMGHLVRVVPLSVWLLFGALLAAQSASVPSASAQSANSQSAPLPPANAQGAQYPPIDEAWDGTSYRALVQRIEDKGLALPTLSDAATKPVFERMIDVANIPLHMGLNRDLSVTKRFQVLDSALPEIHKLVALYLKETKKGKPYASELAKMMIYESKVSAAMLDISERYLATLKDDKRYQVHVNYLDQVRISARQLYSGLVQNMTETQLHSKSDILKLIKVAVDGLPSYQPLFTDQDRQELTQKLTQHIAITTDPSLKTPLTELRDMLQHRRIRT